MHMRRGESERVPRGWLGKGERNGDLLPDRHREVSAEEVLLEGTNGSALDKGGVPRVERI